MTDTPRVRTSPSPLRSIAVVVMLFIGLRITILMVREPSGLMQFGESINLYRVAELTAVTGQLPMVGHWVEYPPLITVLNTGLHQLLVVALRLPDHAYFYAFSLIYLLADTGNLYLIYRIGSRVYGQGRGLDIAWTYALLGPPLVFLTWNFEALTAFFMLLGLWWLLEGKDARSAISIAAGALTKVMPGLLVPVAWRFRSLGDAIRYTGTVAALGILAYLPFFIASPTFTLASMRSQVSKASWQTIWALIDGNFRTGNFGGAVERLDPERAGVLIGNPPVIPRWLTLLVFGALYLYLFTRPMRQSDRAIVAFFGMTWCVFLLWSKGWSPQWMAMLLPLILLVFPNRQGVLVVLVFSILNFLEWPVLISRGMWTGLYLTVILRTLILIGLLVAFYQECRAPESTSIQAGEAA